MEIYELPGLRLRQCFEVRAAVHQPLAASRLYELNVQADIRVSSPVEIRLSKIKGGEARLQFYRSVSNDAVLLEVNPSAPLHSPAVESVRARFDPPDKFDEAIVSTLRLQIAAQLADAWRISDGDHPLLDYAVDQSETGLLLLARAIEGILIDPAGITLASGLWTKALAELQGLEIHVAPVERRRSRTNRSQWTAMRAGIGRLLVFDQSVRQAGAEWNREQVMLALTGSLRSADPAGWSLAFADRRVLSPVQVSMLLAPLAASYSINLPDELADGPVEVTFSVWVPESACSVLLHAPSDHEPGCGPAWAAVSVAIQKALRQWLPYLYFTAPDAMRNPEAAWAMEVYSASRPYFGKTRAELTWDVLDSRTLRRVARSASANLYSVLARIESVFNPGRVPTIVPSRRRKRRSRVLRFIIRDRKLLNTLLAAETFLVDEFVKFGVAIRTPSREIRDIRTLAGVAADFTKALEIRLRKWYRAHDFTPLVPLLLIEATNALAMHRGRPDALRAEVCVIPAAQTESACSEQQPATCEGTRFYCIKRHPWG
jgi:hypothetical protein